MKIRKNLTPPLKSKILFIGIGFLLATTVIIATTPLHETAHWMMSTYFDPYIEVVEFHPFGVPPKINERHDQPFFALGCVVVKEAYPGAFQDRPIWADIIQEIICVFLQIIIACTIVLKSLMFLTKKHKF